MPMKAHSAEAEHDRPEPSFRSRDSFTLRVPPRSSWSTLCRRTRRIPISGLRMSVPNMEEAASIAAEYVSCACAPFPACRRCLWVRTLTRSPSPQRSKTYRARSSFCSPRFDTRTYAAKVRVSRPVCPRVQGNAADEFIYKSFLGCVLVPALVCNERILSLRRPTPTATTVVALATRARLDCAGLP